MKLKFLHIWLGIWFLGLILFYSNVDGKTEFQGDSSLTKFTIAKDSLDTTKIYLQLENQMLKGDINAANRIIEQQNSQLEQANDILNFYYAILGVALLVISFFIYFQFWKPSKDLIQQAKDLIKEAKDTNEKSNSILNNLNDSIRNVVEERYRHYENKKFQNALDSLGDAFFGTTGIPAIRQQHSLGFTEDQVKMIFDFFKEGKPADQDKLYNSGLSTGCQFLFDALISRGETKRLKAFLDDYFSNINNSEFHPSIYEPLSRKTAEYIGKNIEVGNYTDIYQLLKNIHPKIPNKPTYRLNLFNTFLINIINNKPLIIKKILNDQEFIEILDQFEIMENIILNSRKINNNSEGDFGTRVHKYGETLFLNRLIEIDRNLQEGKDQIEK